MKAKRKRRRFRCFLLSDAVAGRAPEAVVMMNTLGIAWRGANRQARRVTDVLPELADRIAAIRNPALRARVGTALLGAAGEQLLPICGADGGAWRTMPRRRGITA